MIRLKGLIMKQEKERKIRERIEANRLAHQKMIEEEQLAKEIEEMKEKELKSGKEIKIVSKAELREQVKFMDVNQLKLNPTNLYIFQDYIENLNHKAGKGTENEAETRKKILKITHDYKDAQISYT